MTIPSWAAQIDGSKVDLEYLAQSQTDDRVRVEKREDAYLLLGSQFDALPDHATAESALTEVAEIMTGLLIVLRFAKQPILIREVFGVDIDGAICQRFYPALVGLSYSFDDGTTIYTSGNTP